jgi:hypothetical protein
MKRWIAALFAMATLFVFTGSALADLYVRGSGTIVSSGSVGAVFDGNHDPIGSYDATGMSFNLIYDDVQEITWFDFTQVAAYGETQINWAEGLEVAYGGTTLDTWRLTDPGSDPKHGSGDTGSEMGHLYHLSLGNDGTPPFNAGPFEELYAYTYWTGIATQPPYYWRFNFRSGHLGTWGPNEYQFNGMAVIDGDVGAVPIPGAAWLLGSGLLGLIGIRRKFGKK